jgi:hypothetical protein
MVDTRLGAPLWTTLNPPLFQTLGETPCEQPLATTEGISHGGTHLGAPLRVSTMGYPTWGSPFWKFTGGHSLRAPSRKHIVELPTKPNFLDPLGGTLFGDHILGSNFRKPTWFTHSWRPF